MLFNSLPFLLFFPFVLLLYYLVPNRFRNIWLLFASFFYYASANPKYIGYLVISILITYLSGLLIDKANTDFKRKLYLTTGILLNLSILVFFKFGNFTFDLILPIGISFYTFQSLTYVIGVYRKELPPQKNILTYALFVSFFPTILAGPIERAGHLLPQFQKVHAFHYDTVRRGLQQMLWGYFQKMVLAGRLSILVDLVYASPETYAGFPLVIATICYGLQIYCDFASYSNIAIGAAKVMGFDLAENFRQPYFASSAADFWRRWHISLSSWFRDYLYIPLGGSRVSKFRKCINLMIVFLVSGLWHGNNITFLIWGGLNGFYQVIGSICRPVKLKADNYILSLKTPEKAKKLYHIIQVLFTFVLINFTWIFFRADNMEHAFQIIRQMFSAFNPEIIWDGGIYALGLGMKNFYILFINLLVLWAADSANEKTDIYRKLSSLRLPVRWMIYYYLIGMILLSCNLSGSEFIYMNF